MSGRRFYVGQPVVCVGSFDNMRSAAARAGLRFTYPERGQRYTVAGYARSGHAHRVDLLHVAEIPVEQCGCTVYWGEEQFAPITENQVQAIIAVATDLPAEMETEDA